MISKSIFLRMMFLAFSAWGMEGEEPENPSSLLTRLGASYINSINSLKNPTQEIAENTAVTSFHWMGSKKVVEKVAIPLNGQNPTYRPIGWGNYSEKIEIHTLDGVRVTGNWAASEGLRTVIMFHGNGMNADHYRPWAKWFNQQGFNALALTIQGYPGSEGTSENLPKASALLVEAAFRFVIHEKNIPLDKIAVYGFSLGGTYATYAGRYLRVPVILQNTFTALGDIPLNIISQYFPSILGRAIARSNLDYHSPMPKLGSLGVFASWGSVPLNPYNNIENLKNTERPVMILFGEQDKLMGGQKGAQELYKARYGKDVEIDLNLFVKISKGEHCDVFLGNSKAEEQVKEFLKANLK
ncbi:MAG: alpha/beta hydrolase [Candidatus Paracaedibacteraceae bacterium]|nr:alpha/beta hydrolase [Candidatus Paracaedibacteraceae bacterium]